MLVFDSDSVTTGAVDSFDESGFCPGGCPSFGCGEHNNVAGAWCGLFFRVGEGDTLFISEGGGHGVTSNQVGGGVLFEEGLSTVSGEKKVHP